MERQHLVEHRYLVERQHLAGVATFQVAIHFHFIRDGVPSNKLCLEKCKLRVAE